MRFPETLNIEAEGSPDLPSLVSLYRMRRNALVRVNKKSIQGLGFRFAFFGWEVLNLDCHPAKVHSKGARNGYIYTTKSDCKYYPAITEWRQYQRFTLFGA